MKYTLLHTDKNSSARAGLIETAHGNIETPIFMPVGTAGTVKAVHQRELKNDIMVGTNQFLQIVVAIKFFHWLIKEN